jgi:hypothetical protein
MSEGRRIRPIVSIGARAIAPTWALSACAPGAGGEVAARAGDLPWAGLEGREREDALLEAAKSEGTLLVSSAFNDAQSMADAFAEKYGLKVEVYPANSESVLQRASKEVSAGQISNDVPILPAIGLEAVNDDRILSVYESEYRDAVSDKGKGEDRTGVRRLAFLAGWNTEHLDPGGVPTDYADLADPAGAGRLSMEMSDCDWYATLADHYRDSGMSDSEVAAGRAGRRPLRRGSPDGRHRQSGSRDALPGLPAEPGRVRGRPLPRRSAAGGGLRRSDRGRRAPRAGRPGSGGAAKGPRPGIQRPHHAVTDDF